MIDSGGEEGSKLKLELVKNGERKIINIEEHRKSGEFHPSKRREPSAGPATIIHLPKK